MTGEITTGDTKWTGDELFKALRQAIEETPDKREEYRRLTYDWIVNTFEDYPSNRQSAMDQPSATK